MPEKREVLQVPGGSVARLEIISNTLESDEQIQLDVRALLLNPGSGLKKREAEGFLTLTSRRLMFATARHGILVDAPISKVTPTNLKHRITMTHLSVQTDSTVYTFVLARSPALRAVNVINANAGE